MKIHELAKEKRMICFQKVEKEKKKNKGRSQKKKKKRGKNSFRDILFLTVVSFSLCKILVILATEAQFREIIAPSSG